MAPVVEMCMDFKHLRGLSLDKLTAKVGGGILWRVAEKFKFGTLIVGEK